MAAHPLRFISLFFVAAILTGCVSLTTDDLIPRSLIQPRGEQYAGTVNVQVAVFPKYCENEHEFLNTPLAKAGMIREAMERTIDTNRLFTKTVRGNADYVLDVWVEKIKTNLKIAGEGYIFDVSTVWRLTRADDGKVLACDFVTGHGAGRGFGSNAPTRGMGVASQDMIKNGLSMISDHSSAHLGAYSTAGMRTSMGPASPEGYARWADNVRKNWPSLRMAMGIDEVEKLIGPVRNSNALNRYYKKKYTQEFTTGLYTLVFINDRLSRWELRN